MKGQDKDAEIKFFDRFDRRGGYNVFDISGYRKIIKIMKKIIPLKNGAIIYDMGCGSGAFTFYLANAYPKSRVIGIDISKGCILRAKKDSPAIEFQIDDVEHLKIKNGSADLVCYSGILHHFPDFSKVAQEAFRILKPGGKLFSYDPNLYNPAFWLYRNNNSPFYSSKGITSNERLLKAREIKKVFSNYGIEMKTKIVSGIKFRYVESKKASPLLSVYNFMDQILAITPLASLFGSFILGFGKKQ